MRNVKIMHSEATQGFWRLANPVAKPGYDRHRYVMTMEVLGVPDEVSNGALLQHANEVVIWPARAAITWDELGSAQPGAILRRPMLTMQEAAAATGKSLSAIKSAIYRGSLPCHPTIPGRTVLIDSVALEAWNATAKVGRPANEKAPD